MKLALIALVLATQIGTLSKGQQQKLPYNSVDCDNANGNPKLCTVEPDERPTVAWVIIGNGLDLKCKHDGCVSPNAYWTGTNTSFVKGWPKGWSRNFKDAKQYGPNDPDPNFDIPNGMHCCYAEYLTPVNLKSGKEDWTGR